LEGGPPCFPPGSTCPAVLGVGTRVNCFSSTRLSLSVACLSRHVRLNSYFVTLCQFCNTGLYAPQPQLCNACRLTHSWFGLFPFRSPLLWKSRLISFPPATKMFQFAGSGFSYPIYSGKDNRGLPLLGSPIRISTDLCSLAAPRSVSPLAASFFASWYLGIHHTPFVS
jgi:hypothetical protein